jgi:hypothetical protein
MVESATPKPESATNKPQHQVEDSKIFEVFGNVSDCVGLLVGNKL